MPQSYDLLMRCIMIEMLLASLGNGVPSPIVPLPAPTNPDDWYSSFATTVDDLGENIYFAAGLKLGSVANFRVMVYNIATKMYTELPALPSTFTPTNYCQMWCKNSTLYIMRTGKMLRLVLGETSWTQLTYPTNPNNMPKYGGATLIYNGRLLSYGLLDSPGYEQAICEYIPATNTFVRVAIRPTTVYQTYTSLSAMGTKFYMTSTDNIIDIYDISTNQWTKTTQLPVNYITRALATGNDKVVMFGGGGANDVTYAYVPATLTFERLTPLKLVDANGLFVRVAGIAYSLQQGKLLSYQL